MKSMKSLLIPLLVARIGDVTDHFLWELLPVLPPVSEPRELQRSLRSFADSLAEHGLAIAHTPRVE